MTTDALPPANSPDRTILVGTVTRLVTSYGASWGLIAVDEISRKTFFNRASFVNQADLEALRTGDEVRFEAEPDSVNGSRAVNLTLSRSRLEEKS
jgi:cold shock CspA family protein